MIRSAAWGMLLVVLALPPRALAEESNDDIARNHYDQATRFYEARDYESALTEFELAKRFKPSGAFDYNIARCHERLDHLDDAIAAFRRYIASKPKDAREVEERVKVLEERRAAREAARPVEPPVAPPPEAKRSLALPLVVGGVALVAAIAGTILVATVAPEYEALRTSCAPHCTQPQWAGIETRATAGYVVWGVAGAAALVDVVLWVLAARSGGSAEKTVWIAPAVGGMAMGGRF